MWRILASAFSTSTLRPALRGRRTTLLAFALTLAACGGDGGAGPTTPSGLDVTTLDARTDRIRAIFAQPVIAAVAAQGATFGLPVFDRAIAHVVQPLAAARLVPRPATTTVTASGASSLIIPDTLLGKTLVIGSQGLFVVDPARTGAPADGVRFVVNASGSSTELGYVQLVDSSSASTAHLTVEVVNASATTVFHATLTGSVTGTNDTFVGFATDGTDRVDFTIQLQSAAPNGVPRQTVTALVRSSPGVGVAADDTLITEGLTAQDAQVLNFTAGTTHLRFTTPSVPDPINGGYTTSDTTRLTVNGTAYATIIETGASVPTVRRADGTALPTSEQDAIVRVGIAQAGLFAALLIPVVVLTWLGSVGGGLP